MQRSPSNAAELSVEASGASDFKGFDMTTNYCTAEASGASSVNITVNKELTMRQVVPAASDLKVRVDPILKQVVQVMSLVSRKHKGKKEKRSDFRTLFFWIVRPQPVPLRSNREVEQR